MDQDPDSSPDPTPFFIDFKDAKKNFFSIFFFLTFPQAYHLQSKKFDFLHALFQSAQNIYEKREGSVSGSGSIPLTNGSGSGRPKNMRILRIPIAGSGSGSPNTALRSSSHLFSVFLPRSI